MSKNIFHIIWILKEKKKGKNFYYVKKNKIINNPKILDRIKKLVIPPARTNVLIATNPNDKVNGLQVMMIKDVNNINIILNLFKNNPILNIMIH